jgi:hypothetical protein
MKIEKTKNYELFVKNDEQRPINVGHAKRLAANMVKYGFIPSKPIQAYRKGNKLVVVDGHHRLEAAKAANIPVCYVVEEKTSQDTMASENSLVKKWVTDDFVRLYASRGIPEYKEIMNYAAQGIPIGLVVMMLAGWTGGIGNNNRALQFGAYKIKTRKYADAAVAIIKEFGQANDTVKNRTFITCLVKCMVVPAFSVEFFVGKLRANIGMLDKTSNADQMLAQFESIYNYRSRQTIPLKYLVSEEMKSRHEAFVKGKK